MCKSNKLYRSRGRICFLLISFCTRVPWPLSHVRPASLLTAQLKSKGILPLVPQPTSPGRVDTPFSLQVGARRQALPRVTDIGMSRKLRTLFILDRGVMSFRRLNVHKTSPNRALIKSSRWSFLESHHIKVDRAHSRISVCDFGVFSVRFYGPDQAQSHMRVTALLGLQDA